MEINKVTQSFFSLMALFLWTLSCDPALQKADLLVTATKAGPYQIYRETREGSQAIEAQALGFFNKRIELPPAHYILSTKCSQIRIELKANTFKTLKTYELEFIPPDKESKGNLIVECQSKLGGKRNKKFVNQFSFLSFREKEVFKVAKKTLFLNFEEKHQNKKIYLASLSVKSKNLKEKSRYFLFEKENSSKETHSERLNETSYLLPSTYIISLHGSKRSISLTKGQEVKLESGQLIIKKPFNFKAKASLTELRRPYKLLLNENYQIFFDEKISLLSGEHNLQFENSKENIPFFIENNETTEIKPKSFLVQNECQRGIKRSCSRKKELFIFSKGKELLYQGITNVPFVHLEEPVGISFLNSKGIIYWLTKRKELKTGTLILKPNKIEHIHRDTEFARIEPESLNITGFSQDIKSSKESELTLLEGNYKLTIYLKEKDGERKKTNYGIKIKAGETLVKKFPYYIKLKKKKKSK